MECANCGDRIFSNSRYDFVSCDCNGVFIDGGLDHRRWGGHRSKQAEPITREIPDTGPTHPYYHEEPA